MLLNKSIPNLKINIVNLLFALIPASYIAGNLILNVNIVLFIILVSVFYGKDLFSLKLHFLDKFIIIFFCYTLLTSFYNNIFVFSDDKTADDYTIIIKSIFYTRFLILYFIIRLLIEKDLLKLKYFFISSTVFSIFVCLDLIYQFNFGKDIFGYEVHPRRLSGPFGDELIAGSYLQRFSFFSFFLLPIFYNLKDKKIYYISFVILLCLIIFSLALSGNRIPFIMFILMMAIVLLLEKETRKLTISFLMLFSIVFLIAYNLNPYVKYASGNFVTRTSEIISFLSVIISDDKEIPKVENNETVTVKGRVIQIPNTYIKEFNSGFQTWLKHKYIGGGIKSFKQACAKTDLQNCGPHPHNYYLEVMAELGLIGLLMLILIFVKIFYDTFVNKYIFKSFLSQNRLIIPFMFLFFIEIFPVKTTGSFFTTGNATYLYLVMSITVALSRKKI